MQPLSRAWLLRRDEGQFFFSEKKNERKAADLPSSSILAEILILNQNVLFLQYIWALLIIKLWLLPWFSYYVLSCIFSHFFNFPASCDLNINNNCAILAACGSAFWMSSETLSRSMDFICRIFLCRSQKIVPIFICFVIRKRLIIDYVLKAIITLFWKKKWKQNWNERVH